MAWTNEEVSTAFAGAGGTVGGAVGAGVASAATITLKDFVTSITGSTAINTINGMIAGRFYVVIPAAASTWTLTTAGNVATSLTPVVGEPVFLVYDGAKVRVGGTNDARFVNVAGDTMTGALLAILGSAAAPGLAFSGDPDTGVYSPAANQVAITVNGIKRGLFIASGSETFSVYGDNGATGDAQFYVRGLTNENKQLRLGFDTTNDRGQIQATHVGVAVKDLVIQPSGGNVGIGGASPASNIRLASLMNATGEQYPLTLRNVHVSGQSILQILAGDNTTSSRVARILFTAAETARQDWEVGMGGTKNWKVRDLTAVADRLTIDTLGNTAIGSLAALATTATDGFVYIPTCAGTPTGTPTAYTGKVPMVFDTTGVKIWFYTSGAWKGVVVA